MLIWINSGYAFRWNLRRDVQSCHEQRCLLACRRSNVRISIFATDQSQTDSSISTVKCECYGSLEMISKTDAPCHCRRAEPLMIINVVKTPIYVQSFIVFCDVWVRNFRDRETKNSIQDTLVYHKCFNACIMLAFPIFFHSEWISLFLLKDLSIYQYTGQRLRFIIIGPGVYAMLSLRT